MLHILLLVLKVIGIILAVILGILVLLVCVVLFAPVCYEIRGKCGGNLNSLRGKIKITWFFRLVRADVHYKNRTVKWRLQIAWKKFLGGSYVPEEITVEKPVRRSQQNTVKYEMDQEKKEEQNEREEDFKKEQKEPEEPEEIQEPEAVKRCQEIQEDYEKTFQKPEKSKETQKTRKENEGKIGRLCQKIKRIYHRIKCTIQNFCGRIKSLLEKKEKLTQFFLEDETHTGAFAKVKKECFRLIKKLRPKKLEIRAVIGFEDPVWTGRTLAVFAFLYPFFEDRLEIRPDFEKKILKGSLYCKGHMRGIYFISAAWRLFWCKNVRKTYKDFKNFEL